MTELEAMLAIQDLMDGIEWNADTLDAIAQIMVEAGYKIHDLDGDSLYQSGIVLAQPDDDGHKERPPAS